MKHEYIDISKLYDFSKKKTQKGVIYHLFNLDLSNVAGCKDPNVDWVEHSYYVEYVNYLGEELYYDYENGLANYEAYVEPGMNARLMMELRKSAILPMGKEHEGFYAEHSKFNTAAEVKEYRAKYLSQKFVDYQDLDWQYYMIARHYNGKKAKDIVICYETCFADADRSKQTSVERYMNEFVAEKTKYMNSGLGDFQRAHN